MDKIAHSLVETVAKEKTVIMLTAYVSMGVMKELKTGIVRLVRKRSLALAELLTCLDNTYKVYSN